MEEMLIGAIAMACFAVGTFFIRYWRTTGDRFFLYFAASFWIQALNRVHMGSTDPGEEYRAAYYLVRLLAYVLILLAIWEKNRRRPLPPE
jgi:hypothetical protein